MLSSVSSFLALDNTQLKQQVYKSLNYTKLCIDIKEVVTSTGQTD